MPAPVVTANFTRLQFGETIALSSMFNYFDADGDALSEVRVSDLGFGIGQFFVNGVAQPEGTEFTVTALELPNTIYQAGFFTGGETFSVSASDGSDFSPVSTETIRVGNTAPQVSTIPSVVPIDGQIPFLSMIRVTDVEMDPVVEYRVRDNGDAPGSGSFLLDGNLLEPFQWHDISASEAIRLRYRGGSVKGSESFSVTADDGLRSAVAAGRVVTGNSRPVIEPRDDINVLENGEIFVKDMIDITDADGDSISRYFVVDRRDNADSGHLELNNAQLDSATVHSLTPTQFASLIYVGAPAGPKFEDIGIQVLDDAGALSEFVDFQVRTTAPVVIQPTNKTSVLTNQAVDIERLFNAYDPDNPAPDAIRGYYFVDRRPNANGGHFLLNGVRQESAVWFYVAPENLSSLQYVGASFGPDSEFIGIQALDEGGWSDPVDLPILTDSRPTATGIDASILEAYSLDVAPLVSGTNSTGAPAEAFRLTDLQTSANSGYFEFRGTRVPSGEYFEVQASDINDLKYIGGAFGEQIERIRLQAIVGGVLSDASFFNITTLENEFAPTVRAFDVDSRVGSVIDFASMFSWSDADGPPTMIDTVRFYDTGIEADSGYFSINDVRQPAREWIEVSYDLVQQGEVRYHVSNRRDSELYRVTVNDGRFQSTLDTGEVIAIAAPELTPFQNDFSVDTIERISIGNFIAQTDSGPPLVEYQVYDENTDTRSGRIELDGTDLQQGIVHTLTAAEFDRLVFKGAEADFGRQIDGMLVRGRNGVGLYTEWTRFNVNTDPVGAAALNSPFFYNNTSGGPVTEITYSFIDGGVAKTSSRQVPLLPLPFYYPAMTNCMPGPIPGVEARATAAFNQPQREATRALLSSIEQYANVRFREVAFIDDVTGLSGADAQITFGTWQMDCGAPAYAWSPSDFSGLGDFPGDVWLDWQQPGWDPTEFDAASGDPLSVQGPGTDFDFHVLRTLGTSLGFSGAGELSIFNNFDYNTLQGSNHFNGNSQFDSAYPELPSSFMLYDIVRLQEIYGVRTDFNLDNNHFRFDQAHQQSIYDSGGIDTLNLTSHVVDTIVDLREGQRSTLESRGEDAMGNPTFTAFDNSVLIPYGVVIENARTGSGSDRLGGNEISNLLIANDGSDVLIGRGGNDVLRGGDGADTYIWNLGDGRDTIIDLDVNVATNPGDRERDRFEINVQTGDLNSLADDMRFRRLGNTLRIDFTLNQAEAQGSVVIQNFHLPENQIETLALFGPPAVSGGDNQQVGNDIDLISVWEQSGTLAQRFRDTGQTGDYGNLVTPV